jgi:tetratricopeptide (TPR) repeat protein
MTLWNGLGYVYDLRSDFPRALDVYMKGLEIAEKTKNDRGKSYFYNNIAVIYDRSGSYRKGLGYYKKALSLFKKRHDSVNYANALINIGLAYKNMKMIDSANYFYSMSLPIQQRLKNYYGITNLYNNLGELKFEAKDYHGALQYYLLSQQMIQNLDSLFWGSRGYLNVQVAYDLGRTFQEMKEYAKAMKYYREVKRTAGQSSFLSFETDAIKGISEIFEKTGKADSALKYSRLHLVYYDSLKKTEDNQRLAVIESEFTYKKEKEREALEYEKQEVLKKRKEMKLLLMIGATLTISVILLLVFMLQRSKIRRMNLLKSKMQLEKSNLMKDLSLKNRELASKVMSLIEKNELLAEMSERLKKIIPAEEDSNAELLRSMIHELQHQHSEGFWEEFNVHFKETNPNFYNNLSKEFAALSPNEVKLCAFLKLNLSTKEISMITRKNEHSIKIARYRLRQKFGISRDENLVMFLGRY